MNPIEDLRYAIRRLAKSPGFTLTAILALALGLGINSVVFSLLDATLLRPLPFREPERLVAVWDRFPLLGWPKFQLAAPEIFDLREQIGSFEGVAAYEFPFECNFTGDAQPMVLSGAKVTANFYSVLGVKPLLGRLFRPEEGQEGNEHVVLLGEDFFAAQFGRDPHVIGRQLDLDDQRYTVIGVLPAEIRFPGKAQFVLPEVLKPAVTERGNHFLNAIARLKPTATLALARADANTTARRLEKDFAPFYPPNSGWDLGVVPLRQELVGEVRPILLLLLGAAALVLVLTCANLAHLLLIRAEGRAGEMGIRVSLGASQGAIRRQYLWESLLISGLGCAVALALAGPCLDLLRIWHPKNLPNLDQVHLDLRMVVFSFVLALLVALLFSRIPERAEKIDLARILVGGVGRSTVDRSRQRRRRWLVAAEVAISCLILAAAALLLRSFLNIEQVSPGFRSRGVLACKISPSPKSYESAPQVDALYRHLLESLGALPGVETVGAVTSLPMADPNFDWSFEIEGRPVPPGQPGPTGDYQVVEPDYFKTLGIPILRGRAFDARDDSRAVSVLVVNETMARRYWPKSDPIGRRIRLGGTEGDSWATIVGVVRDVRHEGLDHEPRAVNFFPHAQFEKIGATVLRSLNLVLRTGGDPKKLEAAVRHSVWDVDPNLPIARLSTLDEEVAASTSDRRFALWLFIGFALLALFLAALGTYGVISYTLTQRSREIAIRLALGGTRSRTWRLLLRQGMLPVGIGLAIGIVGALAFGRLLESQLFGVTATDPGNLAGVAVVLSAVAVIAISIPAWRAVHADSLALRSD